MRSEHDGENSEKRKWWLRIGLTVFVVVLISSMVLASVLYRTSKTGTTQRLAKSEDEDFEKFADRTFENADDYTEAPTDDTPRRAVFAEHPFCAETGSKVLGDGGSAVDAGIAMLLCQGVVEPHHSGLGGGFLMMIYVRETKQVVTLDARPTAPRLATARMFETFNTTQDGQFDSRDGQEWLTVAVPGEGKGLWEAHKKYGKLPWHRLVNPAIRLAFHGFPISHNLAEALLRCNDTIQKDPYLRKVFINPATNETYREGKDVVNEGLAKVLMRFASEGADCLYTGETVLNITEESLQNGGVFIHRDFSDYEVKWSYSLPHVFRDSKYKYFTLHMPPPPSSAIMIGMILNIAQGYERVAAEQEFFSPSRIAQLYHKIVEAMKHTFARKGLFGDSAPTSMRQLYKFLSPHWGLTIRNSISPTDTFSPQHYLKQSGTGYSNGRDSGTSSVGAVAANGDAIVASSTLNDPFGSGIVSEKLGFLLNNNMLAFTMTKNGTPIDNDFNNIVRSGKRPVTSLCPIIVLDDKEDVKLLMAASGGVRIPTTMALILIRYFWLNEDIQEALLKLRFHHQLIPNTILYEGTDKQYNLEYLRAYGHDVHVTDYKWPHVSLIVQENRTMVNANDDRENT